MSESTSGSPLDRLLRLFADVRAGEGFSALLMALNVFLVLTAYYIIKPLRDGLVVAEHSAEMKAYLQVANVFLLALVVPAYGKLTDRFPRRRLINVVTWIFVGALGGLFVMGQAGVPLGIIFFVYGSIFAVMIVAQFWSFANDIYTREEGERLFPIVAFGASLGGVFGAAFVYGAIRAYGVYIPMVLAAVVLLASLLLTNLIDSRERQLRESHLPDIKTTATIAASGIMKAPKTLEELEEMAERERLVYEAKERGEEVPEPEISSGASAFGLVWRTRYLLLICFLVMLLNWVNTNGGYILDRVVAAAAADAVAAGTTTLDTDAFISSFMAGFYFLTNTLGVLIQLFLTSRIVKYGGVHRAVLVLPILALVVYGVMAFVPILAVLRWAKAAENSTDYSLNNTVKNILFLPTTREQKYKAKQVSDSLFHRAGDMLSAGTVFVGAALIGLGTIGFALFNMTLVVIWLALALAIGREYRGLVVSGQPPRPRGAAHKHPFELAGA